MIRPLAFALILLPTVVLAAPGHDHGPKAASPTSGPTVVLAAIIKPYLKVRQSLVQDDLPEAIKWAGMLYRAAQTHKLPKLAEAAMRFKDARLPAARAAFRDVSDIVIAAVEAFPPARASMKIYDCAQAPGQWLQIGSMPTNPYQGGELRQCGEEIPASEAIKAAAAAAMEQPPAKDEAHDHGDGSGRHAH